MQQRTAHEHMNHGMEIEWEAIRSRLGKALSRQRLVEIGLVAATVTSLGWVSFALHKALENYQILGPAIL